MNKYVKWGLIAVGVAGIIFAVWYFGFKKKTVTETATPPATPPATPGAAIKTMAATPPQVG